MRVSRWFTNYSIAVGSVLAGVFLFAMANASDHSPYQWPSTFICMFTWLLGAPSLVAAYLVERRRRGRADQRGFDVKVTKHGSEAHATEPGRARDPKDA